MNVDESIYIAKKKQVSMSHTLNYIKESKRQI